MSPRKATNQTSEGRVIFSRDPMPPCPLHKGRHFLNPTCSQRIKRAHQQAQTAAFALRAHQVLFERNELAKEREKLNATIAEAGKQLEAMQRTVIRFAETDWRSLLPTVSAA